MARRELPLLSNLKVAFCIRVSRVSVSRLQCFPIDCSFDFFIRCEMKQRWRLYYKKTGRSSSSVQVRLLRFWEASNVWRGGELMGVDMLLLASQAGMLALLRDARGANFTSL
ncbi:Uncharacterized protein Rs2_12123 [Raphanus sativus]|nr:Uncharacterized protein Rs2_12123 [Raphanus sativus]